MNTLSADLPTLWKVIERLEKASIPYMLTGSLALNFYGHVRATNDIDIVIQIDPSETAKIYHLFESDFYISEDVVKEAIQNRGMFNMIDNESVFKVDIIIGKADSFSMQQFARRQRISVGSQKISVISPEDLILSKLKWSEESLSEIQQKDIENIIRVCSEKLNKEYLEKNAKDLGFYERLIKIYDSI